MAAMSINGSTAKIISVSGTLIVHKITNAPMILMPAMKNSSGQWCANSVMSNRSVVMRDMS